MLRKELDSTKQQFNELLKRHQDLEVKSKADIKVLVKEVKSLRSSQSNLTQQLKDSLTEKSKMEVYTLLLIAHKYGILSAFL